MRKVKTEVKQLFDAYSKKKLRPETALEFASNFVLDLVNSLGDRLDDNTPIKDGWRQFAPFEFLLALNKILARFKEKGRNNLAEFESALLVDNNLMIGSLVRSALVSHPDSFPGEEHFQIPADVAEDLNQLVESGTGIF